MRVLPQIDRWLIALAAAAAVLAIALWACGLTAAAPAPDTAGYFIGIPADLWGTRRHPLYGFMALLFGAGPERPGLMGEIQVALHMASAFALYFGAQAGGIGRRGAFFLAIAALFSQSALLHVGLLLPETPAISMLTIAFAATLAASRSRKTFWIWIAPVALTAASAYLLRPSFLPAIAGVPVLWLLFAVRNGQRRAIPAALLLLLAIVTPFVVQSAIRWRAVGEFNIVSFGGYQMSALAGFMLTPDLIARLPDAVKPTAQAILTARDAGERAGLVAPTPINSSGERSFVSAALGYFDVYARAYDPLLGEILKLQRPGESWVAFDTRLRQFSLATIMAAPVQWLAWIGGSLSRLTGRIVVTNLPMLVASAALLLAGIAFLIRRGALDAAARDIAPVIAVALAWMLCTGPLIVLVTFPGTRYIDTAGALLPAIPALLAASIAGGLRARAPSPPAAGSA